MRVAFGKVGEKHESMNEAMYMYMHSTHMHMYRNAGMQTYDFGSVPGEP